MNIDGAGQWSFPIAPDMSQQRASRNGFSPVLDKVLEQSNLSLRQVHSGSIARQRQATEIHAPLPELMRNDFRFFRFARPHQENFDSSAEVLKIDGLDQIIIGTRIEYLHTMWNLGAVRQHEERYFDLALPEVQADIHRIQPRLGVIDEDQIETVGQSRIGVEFRSGGDGDAISPSLQGIRNVLACADVFANQK